jgi:putative restriction endonuclease
MSAVNHEQRAAKAWPVLAAVAKKHGLITYGDLGAAIGIHHRAVAHVLGVIQTYCLEREIPPLNILAVNKDTRRPGHGFIAWDASDMLSGRAEVYARNWDDAPNPFGYASDGLSSKGLAQRIADNPSGAAEVYRLVKDRGIAQRIFRDALYIAYDGACAFCGLTFEEALQGAHIVKWGEATQEQRLAPSNGLLLCATHHQMFDAGLMVVGPDGTIVYCEPEGVDEAYSDADIRASFHLHGRKVRMPRALHHRTTPDVWSWRYENDGWDKKPWRFR